jgi:hypothetical protein
VANVPFAHPSLDVERLSDIKSEILASDRARSLLVASSGPARLARQTDPGPLLKQE